MATIMRPLEDLAVRVRRSSLLRQANPLWRQIRPVYQKFLGWYGKDGIERNINRTDRLYVVPELYTLSEDYESDVWPVIMGEVHLGDVIADVGANIGLYTIALANRVGSRGRVLAFEPDEANARVLRRHVSLNQVVTQTEVRVQAVGDREGFISFLTGQQSESRVSLEANAEHPQVEVTTLDSVFQHQKVDILKIDVEGFEAHVLRGAMSLLRDAARAPRVIFVEFHPHAGAKFGLTGESLLELLRSCAYQIFDTAGRPIDRISEYGEIVARRIRS